MTKIRWFRHTCGFLFFAVFFLSGCTIIRSDSPDIKEFNKDRLAQGEMHYKDILRDLGPPTKMSQLNSGMIWLYEDIDFTEKQFGFGFRDWPLSIFKFNVGSANGLYMGQMFIFDKAGKLLSYGDVEKDIYLGSGVDFQFIFKVSSLVNLSDMQGVEAQNLWGQTMLKELPASLNNAQDMETGRNGTSLITTPQYTGQESLTKP